MPRVTILMPTYNVAPWVEEAIHSVLAQTYTDFTLLVLDDCSTDNTLEVVRGIPDPRIKIVEGDHNVGLSENLNRGLDIAETELLARMDGDDIAEPTWLAKGIEVLDAHPEIGICSFGFQFFGAKTSVVRFPEHHEDSLVQMLFGCTVIIPVFRRSVMIDNGLRYSIEAFPAEDYDMWSRCYKVTRIYNVQETMFHYRTHATQISTSKRQAQIVKSNEVRRIMLEWLNPLLKESNIQFFLETFLPGKIKKRKDLNQLKDFAIFLLSKSDEVGHFSHDSLKKKLCTHIVLSLYKSIAENYFNESYSIRNYIRYLRSGLAFKTTLRYEGKFLVKSLVSSIRICFTNVR